MWYGESMLTAEYIYRQLEQTNRQHAVPLMDAICDHASKDAEYATVLSNWLANGGTLILRDDLCDRFKYANLFKGSKRRYPWFDAFTALDSISAGCQRPSAVIRD